MKIGICSRSEDFHADCRSMLKTWSTYICADLQIEQYGNWEGLLSQQPELVFLDADDFQDIPQLDSVPGNRSATFLCSRDSRKAIACYKLRSAAFLSKPLTARALDQLMCQRVVQWHESLLGLELTENRSRLKLPICDILWAEATGRSCSLHCLRREAQIGESMNELVSLLPQEAFVRCQRSYLVNLHHVKSADGKFIYMTDGTAIPIGRSVRTQVLERLHRYQQEWNGIYGE